MRNKGAIIALTVIITILSIYYISFIFVSRSVQKDAVQYATGPQGEVDFEEKRDYLDSVWNQPVYNLFGMEYTFQEVKQNELGLGLDLQGGMHVTLEVSPKEILTALAGRKAELPAFKQAIQQASQAQANSQESYLTLFYRAIEEVAPNKALAYFFASSSNKDYITRSSTDEEVLTYLNDEVESAIERTFQILRTRIDRFGVSSPNIQGFPVQEGFRLKSPELIILKG